MNPKFRYVKHYDLVLHVFAHMKVNNASDLYSKKYIEKMSNARQNTDIIARIEALSTYYNENYQRLMIVHFLPYFTPDYENMKRRFLNFERFTPEDLSCFIKPLIQILDDESLFFFDYWDNMHQHNEDLRKDMEHRFTAELQKYACIFEHHNKPAMTLFSYSITRNGRGIDDNAYLSALVPFPENDASFIFSFFQALHEFTHQFTDVLLNANINMQDGSHDLSECIVVLADYYLIKALDSSRLDDYFEWLSMSGNVTESNLFDMYGIDVQLDSVLRSTIKNILE